MEIKKIKIEEIIPYENNVKEHPKEQIEQIKNSIREFGNNDPIAIDENNVIIEGHGRLIALQELGYKEADCIVLTGLTEEQKNAYRIVHNQLTMNTGFDEELLKEELKKISFDLTDFGLTEEMLEALEKRKEVEDDDFDIDEALDEIEEPKTKLGDLYKLGNHYLLCGDSTNEKEVEKLLQGKKTNMVFTDPPYLMNFTGNVHADGTKSFNAKFGAIKNDNMTREEGDIFVLNMFKIIQKYNVGAYYVCFYRLGLDYIFRALDKLKNEYKALIIWDKGNHTLSNSDYMSKYEPIVYGWFNEHNFYGDRSNFDIWNIQRTLKNDLHPTMKPIELVAKAVQNSTRKNEYVLDLFGGSGSTLIACEQLERKCFIMEIEPKYCDVIIKRWETLTGQKAELIKGNEVV